VPRRGRQGRWRSIFMTDPWRRRGVEVTVHGRNRRSSTLSKQIGGVVTSQELNDIPSINRNFTTYLGTRAGREPRSSRPTRSARIRIRINGGRARRTSTTRSTAPATTTRSTAATAARRRARRSKRCRSSSC
jgi:hypothetical protein